LNERADGERKTTAAVNKIAAELTEMRKDFNFECEKYEIRLKELQTQYQILETRYKNRESRPEDLARIAQLEREMVEKDELVAKTKEEMIYFKRELLNREENFNQKFGRSPNVGVMQVIKQKEAPEPKGTFGGKPSSKPTYTVAPGGGALPTAGGLGITNGMLGSVSNPALGSAGMNMNNMGVGGSAMGLGIGGSTTGSVKGKEGGRK
jgi:hypothetical protein